MNMNEIQKPANHGKYIKTFLCLTKEVRTIRFEFSSPKNEKKLRDKLGAKKVSLSQFSQLRLLLFRALIGHYLSC